MNVRQISPTEAERWEAYVLACPRTVAWQSFHWHEAVRRVYAVEFLPLVAEDDGRIVGVLPLYQLQLAGKPSRLLSVPYAVAGGMTADSVAAQQALLDAAVELARARSAPGLTFKQYRYPIDLPLKTDGNYFNRELSLGVGADAVWNQFADRNRAAIDATAGWNLRVEYPSTRVDVFYDLLARHLKRQGMPCPSRAWLQTLLDLKMYSIALLERDGRVVAGTMTKAFKTTVSFPFTCLRDGSEDTLRAGYTLYWRLIQHYIGRGWQIFHSGRMPLSEDVEAYRLGWGGQKHPYFYQYHPETGSATELKTKRGWKRRALNTCWKWMPLPLAKALGPKIVAKFP